MRLIDAGALLESYDVAWMYEYDETGCGVRRKAIPIKCVEEAPTIEAEPVRHGTWKNKPPIALSCATWYYCSVCHSTQGASWMNYCPNCGAKMDGRVESLPEQPEKDGGADHE